MGIIINNRNSTVSVLAGRTRYWIVFFFLALFRGLKDYVIEAVPKITYLTDVSPVPEKPKTVTIESRLVNVKENEI